MLPGLGNEHRDLRALLRRQDLVDLRPDVAAQLDGPDRIRLGLLEERVVRRVVRRRRGERIPVATGRLAYLLRARPQCGVDGLHSAALFLAEIEAAQQPQDAVRGVAAGGRRHCGAGECGDGDGQCQRGTENE